MNSQNQNLKLLQLNCNSIYNKLSEIKQVLLQHIPDIICLSETWIKEKYIPKFPDYIAEWEHRAGHGGGLGILINKNVQYQKLELVPFANGILEIQAIRLTLLDSSKLSIVNLYNPNKNLTVEEITHYTSQLDHNFLITGDFNAHSPLLDSTCRRTNPTGITLENILQDTTICLINPLI